MFNRNKVGINSNADDVRVNLFAKLVFWTSSFYCVLNVCKMADKEFAQKKILVTGVGGGKLIFVHIDDTWYYILIIDYSNVWC